MKGRWLLALFIASTTSAASPSIQCKCFPGDTCWPTESIWNEFNATVGGRLITTELLATPCHDPNYDEGKCSALREQWLYTGLHVRSPSSIMAPNVAMQSCDPFVSRDIACTLGNHVSYTVNVSSSQDIVATLKFAKDHNIRTVIRNTGLDYQGRSTAAGALAIWTHYMKQTDILDWKDDHYEGKALKVGAGVQGFEALAAVKSSELVIVSPESPAIGVVGGYLQGGGYSALSTAFGLAADNVLSFEVATVDGLILTASKYENKGLYWALAGGGGGTYGVVISATLKAHPDATVAGASFTFTLPKGADSDLIFDLIDIWHAELPRIVDSGVTVSYSYSDSFLDAHAITAYNKTVGQLLSVLRPVNSAMKRLGVRFNPTVTSFPSFHDHYEKYWGLPDENIQVSSALVGGRLISRDALLTPEFDSMTKQIGKMGVTFHGVAIDVSRFGQGNSNSVLPQWRTAILQSSFTLPWNAGTPLEEQFVVWGKAAEKVKLIIEAATPGAGVYMNEANTQLSDWQTLFYGENYEKLLEAKKKYDPEGLLFVEDGVGGEDWKVEKDGRVCRVANDGEQEPKKRHDEL